jgi:Tol biopolymer transport system component
VSEGWVTSLTKTSQILDRVLKLFTGKVFSLGEKEDSTMKALNLAVAVVAILFLAASHPVSAQDQAAFEKALLLEEAQARYQDAISAYEEIITRSADPALAAQAQLHIGICYEKLGLEQAQRAYQKVIDDYPTQTEIVVVAKEKLSRLTTTPKTADPESTDFQLLQVWANPYDTMGSPSPDGRYMSYVNWNVPCLAIHDFETGESRDIAATTGTWEGDSIWAESSLWSPDGKNLAYVWYGKEYVSIRIVGVGSSEPVELFGDKNYQYCHPSSWSSDGNFILAVLCHEDRTHEIALISVDDHSVRTIKKLEPGYHPWVSLSPDGKYIAYSITPDSNSPQTDIHLLSTVDGTEKALIEHPATDYNPLWMPDGKNIVFFSDRTGTVSAWSQAISNGTADGDEELIMSLNRLRPKAITPSGDLYLEFLEGGFDVYSATLDPESARLISGPEMAVEENVGWNGSACFSPDGKKMAYVSQRGVLDTSFSWGQQSLIIRDLDTGKERELVPQASELVSGRSVLKWSPDSDEILFTGRDQAGRRGKYILNVNDATYEPITGAEDFADAYWASTSEKLYFFYRGETETDGVYSIGRGSQEKTKIVSESNIYGLALRPGSNTLAMIVNSDIKLLNLENKKMTELVELGPSVKHSYIEWSNDGDWLYFIKCRKETVELWRIDSDGKNAQLVEKALPHLANFSIHPDGKKLAFTATQGGGKSSIWLMRNFLR